MKHVVMTNEARVSDVRPPALLDQFRKLSIEEARQRFPEPSLVEVPCPGCVGNQAAVAYRKFGFDYRRCADCRSLFVSPRPTADAVAEYYRDSEAAQFRKEYLTASTPERSQMLRARALWIGRVVDEIRSEPGGVYADVGTIYPGIIHEVGRLELFAEIRSVDPMPSAHLAVLHAGARVVEPEPGSLDAVSAFEQLEHQAEVGPFVQRLYDALAPGGVLLLTSRTCDGFDIQVLGENAPYIFVPEHLNLLSVDGVTRLLERAGFRILELSTPGSLDVELVLQTAREDPAVVLPPFVDHLVHARGAETHADFQQFLQHHRLSSHLRITAVK